MDDENQNIPTAAQARPVAQPITTEIAKPGSSKQAEEETNVRLFLIIKLCILRK